MRKIIVMVLIGSLMGIGHNLWSQRPIPSPWKEKSSDIAQKKSQKKPMSKKQLKAFPKVQAELSEELKNKIDSLIKKHKEREKNVAYGSVVDYSFCDQSCGIDLCHAESGESTSIGFVVDPSLNLQNQSAPVVKLRGRWLFPDALAASSDGWEEYASSPDLVISSCNPAGVSWYYSASLAGELAGGMATTIIRGGNSNLVFGWVRVTIDPNNDSFEGAEGEENNMACGLLIHDAANNMHGFYQMLEGLPCSFSGL